MANRIVQAVYDLRDLITGKLLKINESLRGNRTETEKTSESVDRNNKRLSESFRKTADTVGGLRKGFQSFRDGLNEVGSGLLKITGIAGTVSAALGALSIGRFFGGAVESAKDLEATLSGVQAVSGATAEQLQRMKAAAEAASETTKFTAQEAAAALGELARASGDADTAISQLAPTLNLAQAAGLDASKAAEILTTSMTQFGLAASDSARIADLFAREANSTNDSVESLGLSMSYVAPLARQLGLNIEQTTALLGAMAEQGFKGERAGTALRNVFSQLLDPSSQFRAELVKLNITSGDFESIIQQLAAAGDKGKAALLSLDAAARPAIAALVTSSGAGIRRLTEDFKNAGGEAERTAKKMGENFAGASSRLRNAFDALRRSLVDPILQPLAKQFDAVGARIRAFIQTADFERLKNSIRDFVTGATEALFKFISEIDFRSVIGAISDFTSAAGQFFKSLADKTEDAGRVASTAAALIRTVYSTLETAVFTAAGVITGSMTAILKGLLLARESLARLQGNYELLLPVFDSYRDKIDALAAVTDEFSRRSTDGARATGAAVVELSNRLAGVEPASNKASAALKTLGVQGELTKEKALELSQQFLLLPPNIQKIVEPGLRAAGVFEMLAVAAPKASEALSETASAAAEAGGKIDLSVEKLSKPIPPPDTGPIEQSFRQVAEASGNAADQAASDAQRIVEQQKAVTGALGGSLSQLADNMTYFARTSDQAALTYNKLVETIFRGSSLFSAQALADGTGILRFGEAVVKAFELTEQKIAQQRDTVAQVADSYQNLSAEAVASLQQVDGSVAGLSESLRQQAAEARAGRSAFDLLGAADLGPLAAALDAAAAKVEQLEQQAIAAKNALAGIGDSIQDEIDRIRGNDQAIEDRRFREQLEQIEEQFRISGALGSQEYAEAKRRAEELHKLRLKQIADEKKARGGDNDSPAPKPKPDTDPEGGGGGGGPKPRGGAPSVQVNISGDVVGSDGDSLAEKLARLIKPQLDRIGRMSR